MDKKMPVQNIGSSLLLVVFLIICLLMFAAMTLSTARSGYEESRKMAQRQKNWYAASNTAQEVIASANQLEEGSQSVETSVGEIAVSKEKNQITFSVPVDGKQQLTVVAEQGGDGGWICRKYRTESVEHWVPDTNISVLIPG